MIYRRGGLPSAQRVRQTQGGGDSSLDLRIFRGSGLWAGLVEGPAGAWAWRWGGLGLEEHWESSGQLEQSGAEETQVRPRRAPVYEVCGDTGGF